MIPPHRPPFDLGHALLSVLDRRTPARIDDLEAAWAEACGIPQALLLPSARAGICWALRAAAGSRATVLCPAFTCSVALEAIVRSQARLQVLDIAPEGFLMDPPAIGRAARSPYAVVLSEIYGHAYDLAALERNLAAPPAIRIVDMTMTVPVPALLSRLRGNDFAVMSFGLGKCLYAGWGGVALTRDRALATEVRRMRDAALAPGGPGLALKRAAAILVRTATYHPTAYGLMRKVLKVKPPHADAAAPVAPGPFERWRDPATALPEWYLPSSRPDRYLAMHNLRRRADSAARRLELAARYHRNLDGVAGVGRPPVSLSPLSCYTVRVGPEARRAVYECLWKTGIAATVLFEFLPYLNRQEFPHAWRAASEVLNLPLFESLRLADVDWISEQMARCASRD